MKNIPGKYDRDAQGNIFSPITNIETVYWDESKDYDTYIKEYIDSLISSIREQLNNVDRIYPIGSIYMNVSEIDPSAIFPITTWQRLEGRFLLGANGSYSGGTTGGEASHTLTTNEIPAHNHSLNDPGHTHRYTITRCSYSGDFDRTFTGLGVSSANTTTDNTTLVKTGITIQSIGGGQSHNNMPPYLAVYMWKRIA